MGLLQTLGQGQGYLKAGFQGFQKSGKTYTAILLAIAARQKFGSKSQIAFFDTEGGSEYVAKLVKRLTGTDLVGVRSRSFNDLLATAKEAQSAGIEFLIVDSVTHPWREVCEAYLKKVNMERAVKGLKPRTKLEFQDWNPIKNTWSQWTDFYLNSKMHIIICGRAGYDYDYEINDETGRKELIKTGTKMKTETEFGFEPSLLVEMEGEQKRNGTIEVIHRAVVLGDRFGEMDGKTIVFKSLGDKQKELAEVAKFFAPHLNNLVPGAHAPIDTEIKTDMPVDEQGQDEWAIERKQREILAEEIKGEFVKAGLSGTGKDETKKRIELMEEIFGTTSWTYISEKTASIKMRDGLEALRIRLGTAEPVQEPEPEEAEQAA